MTSTLPKPPRVAFVNTKDGTLTRDGDAYIRGIFTRAGGALAPTNTELDNALAELESATAAPQSDPQAQEAMRAVDELRNEFSSLRTDCDNLRRQLEERESELAALRATTDLRSRVEQLEDRLT